MCSLKIRFSQIKNQISLRCSIRDNWIKNVEIFGYTLKRINVTDSWPDNTVPILLRSLQGPDTRVHTHLHTQPWQLVSDGSVPITTFHDLRFCSWHSIGDYTYTHILRILSQERTKIFSVRDMQFFQYNIAWSAARGILIFVRVWDWGKILRECETST